MTKTCTVDGCSKRVLAHGWCKLHYGRWYRQGDPLTVMRAAAGSGNLRKDGYRTIRVDNNRTFAHILVAERALGRKLPEGAEVHHVNENPTDNRPENLVICPNHAYHMMLHRRAKAYDACGHADWLKCNFCGRYDDPDNLRVRSNGYLGFRGHHLECRRKTLAQQDADK